MEEVIVTDRLTRKFHDLVAVNSLSVSINKGDIYGFLGLNGAGKTTTIRMLLGLISPSSGAAYIKGVRVSSGESSIWKHVGNLVEIPSSYPDLTVNENLELFRRLRQIKDRSATKRAIDKLGLSRYVSIPARNLSQGNAQRLGLAKAMIHNPEILVLDEPSNGLDPAGIVEIREMLTDLASNFGVTIFISSHILGEIAKFTNRIGIIHEGTLIRESGTNDLEAMRDKCLLLRTGDNNSAMSLLGKKGYRNAALVNGIIQIRDVSDESVPEAVAKMIIESGNTVGLLQPEHEDLESFFMRMIKTKGGQQ